MKTIYSLFVTLFLSASVFAAGHVVTASTTTATCFGSCNGTASSLVSGGVGPYGYFWAGPSGYSSSLQNIVGLCAGSYTITVTDSADMSTANYIATVFQPTVLTIGLGGSSVCSGGGCTTLSPLVSGGTPGYTYSWSGGLFGPSPSACPATTTTYTVTVVDMNGCVANATSMVTVMPTPTITVPSGYYVCPGNCVTMTATATGGAAFAWSPGTSLSSTTIANPVSCPSMTTTYTVTAILGGCTATATTTVTVGGLITSGITATNATGCVACDGTATVSPTGGSSPYVYNWSTGATTAAISSLCAGTYSVTITDATGCTITDSITIYSTNDVAANFTMVPDSTNAYNFFCFNSSTGPGMTYLWDFGDGTNSSLPSPSHIYAGPGTYNVCLIAYSFICGSDTLCLPHTVSGVLSSCVSLFNIADDTTTADPNALYVYNLSYGASLTYLWDFGDGTTSALAIPSHIYSGPGPYNLCLTVDNGTGCTETYCDTLTNVDSLNRSEQLSIQVINVPPFQSLSTQVQQLNSKVMVEVFPNPFNDNTTFVVTSKQKGIYSFELTDVLGKNVRSLNGISEKQFNISREGLQNGVYFYKIYTADALVGIGKVIIK